ncbi:tyrosine-type recombinase/integrase [Dongia sp.]|uniref:tyrosine-type recombinase/integrase n=1 Tax=Dongia sp. TaxID=1977262 RepID=UPI0037536DCC
MRLSDLALRSLKPPAEGQITYWDELPGFGVRVSQGGAKTFILQRGKERARTTIGRYPIISLLDARNEAKRLLAEETLGKPKEASIAFSEALEGFAAVKEKKNRARTAKETKRLLTKHFKPDLGSTLVSKITEADISKILDGLAQTPQTANHAYTALKTFLRWAVRKRYLSHSPLEDMERPAAIVSRDRVLTDRELVHIYRTAEQYGYPYGTIVQLLILTGQRRGEIAALAEHYIVSAESLVNLPKELTKNGRPHTFPFGPMTAKVLAGIPKFGTVLFPARGNSEAIFSGWSKSKDAFDKLCPIDHWTLHDLRRTLATGMAAQGVQPHIVERYINHASGVVSGVAAIYNRFQYLPEMRDAAMRWERHLSRLLSDPCL